MLHSGKPEFPNELLHEVNNQLEIVMAAAELLSLQYSEPATKACCAQIQSGTTSIQPALGAVSQADTPAVIGRA